MQGLDLFCKIFVDPGDLVTVESPTYTNGSATALSYGATLLEIPIDDDGMDVDALERLVAAAGRTPKAIYTIPTFQNPSGVTLSLERRLRVLELARKWGAMVIDDDPYGLLRFEGEPLPTLRELGGGDPLVFAVRTFSKIVAPGLRVGWVDTVPELQPLLINAKQAMDTCTNLPAQRLLTGFLTGGHLDDHLTTQRAEYKRRKQAMQAALREHFGDSAQVDRPAGRLLLLDYSRKLSTPQLFSSPRSPRGSRSSRAPRSRRPAGSPTRCGCVSPPPRPTGSTRESPGCAAPWTCSGRTDVPPTAAERAVLDKIDEEQLVELTRSLLRAEGQNPPGEEARDGRGTRRSCRRTRTRRLRGGGAAGPQQCACHAARWRWARAADARPYRRRACQARAGRKTRSAVSSRTAASTAAVPPT